MRSVRVEFRAPVFAGGAALLSVSAGVARIFPKLALPSLILFVAGMIVLAGGVFVLQSKPVMVHPEWSYDIICGEMRKAPSDATIRIMQTWFPYEKFIPTLRDMYLDHGKTFEVDVLLMDPGPDRANPSELLASRVMLRGISTADAVKEVEFTRDSLIRMKHEVELSRNKVNSRSRRSQNVDLEIRFYNFMPFGPIYQIGEEVMFVGFFLNFGTSSEGSMIEVRNTKGNRLWRQLKKQFDDGWAADTSRPAFPVTQAAGGVAP
jgi:hypothetical protein